ncbi:MAG TPA: CTP synthase [Gaiellales bacterium]
MSRQVKYVFVTGGVVSSLGKGITAASLGRLLKSRGLRVSLQKFDPYINVDPGTMSPFQHGEVFVTEDGAETDLDLGHYERFVDEFLSRNSNHTTGSVYDRIIRRERKGEYLGSTVQVIPHVTDEIKRRVQLAAQSHDVDVIITEIGGTVGDIESLPFLEAIRQFRNQAGRDNVMYIHCTLVPFIDVAGELKTKPTQHSVQELRRIGIAPDVVVCRSRQPLSRDMREKIALFADVSVEAVISAPDADDIYAIPLMMQAEGLDRLACERLGLVTGPADMREWEAMVERIHAAEGVVQIALVGKYVQLQDAYLSVVEALRHACIHHGTKLEIVWVDAETLSWEEAERRLSQVDGILIPGGFGIRGIEGKIAAARFAREQSVPYLGVCLGMQVAVVEFARHVVGLEGANSSEFDPETPYPVIDLLPEQKQVEDMGGTMRLGSDPVKVVEGTVAHRAYGEPVVYERHRHRYEVNNGLRAQLVAHGLVVSGTSPDGRLVEIIELHDHPWFCASQFHPEFKSRPNRPQPLFRDFVGAAVARSGRRPAEPVATTVAENLTA